MKGFSLMDISPDAWAAIGAGITTTGAVVIGYFKTHQAQLKVADATEEVRRLAAPTGNGFAERMERALEQIMQSQARTESALIQHLTDHARAEINGKQV
jgi:flagellar hook-basal body complex protein FliE